MTRSIYVIGSMRNPRVPEVAATLRDKGFDVFDDWYSPGPETDDYWQKYEKARGRAFREALAGHHARNVFDFDQFHLNRAHAAVLVLPAGKSGHLEAGALSATKPVFMLLEKEDPDRLDIMAQFLHGMYRDTNALHTAIDAYPWPKIPDLPFFTISDVQWLAGVFEGDGTFCISDNRPRMVLQMTDEDVIARAAKIMGSNVWSGAKQITGRKKVYICGAAGLTAVEWMRIVRPYMGQRRQGQIVASVQKWLEKRAYNKADRDWWTRVFQLEGGRR